MIIDVTKYAVKNNCAVGVCEAIKNLNNGDTLLFPKGEYHFYKDYCQVRQYHMTNTDSFKVPNKEFAILFEYKNNITLDGNGSVFVIHGNMCSLACVDCENMTLKDFTVKYASPSNVELKVIKNIGLTVTYEIPESSNWYIDKKDIIFFEQSPFTKKNYWTIKNNAQSWCSVIHDGKFVCRTINKPFIMARKLTRINATTLEVKYFLKKKYNVGSTIAISNNKLRDTCGLFFYRSKNITSKNIIVNYMQGFGWLTQMCENVLFDTISFKPDNEHNVSSFADCIHVCGCKGQVNINNCYFTDPHDDGINIHGTFLRVNKKIDDNTVLLQFVHNQQGGYQNFFVGDKVKFWYRNDLQQCGDVFTVKSVKDDIDNKLCTVEFNEKLPSDIECKYLNQNNIVAENISYCPNVEISNCTFTAIPTRGILCTTCGHVDIHDNSFDNVQMANIYISNDANDWYESGPVSDMIIHNNKFDVPSSAQREWKVTGAVFIDPVTLGKKVTKPVHKNIKIYDNDIKINGNGYALYSKGAQNITIDDKKNKVVIE